MLPWQSIEGLRLGAMDSTHVKVHRSGSNPAGGQAAQAIGTSRGGLNTKLHAIVATNGEPLAMSFTGGNNHDNPQAKGLITTMDSEAGVETLIADRAYDADATRKAIEQAGCEVCIPPKVNRRNPASYDQATFAKRHVVENFWEVLKRLRRISTRYEKLKQSFPPDLDYVVALDTTLSVTEGINEIKHTLFEALVLVMIVVFVFLQGWRATLIPLLAVPVSLIGAFFIMYISGFTINVLTLLAIVLATGLVVDDGIVVTENIYKKIEGGMPKWQAAKEGSKEIYFAVIATSITLAIVFLPIIFLQGFVGRLFREFGIVVAGAVLISAFVSLTLTPVLNVYLAGKSHKHSWFYTATEPFFRSMENGYRRMLTGFMRARWFALVLLVACFGLIYFVGSQLQSELAPMEDRSGFRLSVTAPEGTSYDAMDKFMDKLSNFLLDSIPEKKYMVSMTAPGFTGSGSANSGFVRIVLTNPSERQRSQQDIVNWVNKVIPRFNQGRAFAIQEQTIAVNRRGGQPVQFVLQNVDPEKIKKVLPKFLEEANKSDVLQGVDADLKFNKPELRVSINRMKASALGVSVDDISQTLQLALSNRRMGYFTKEGKQYQVLGQVERSDRDDPADLKTIYVRNQSGVSIPLENVIDYTEEVTPPTIYHFNRYRSATVSSGLQPGKTVGDGIKEMERISKKLLDESFSTALSGTSRDFAESSGNTLFAFFLALVLIYLVLAAQFESFIDPFTIMFTVPLALAGAVLSLWLFNQTLNIFSQIGMIMLIGLVTKNGILIVEFANKKQLTGEKKIPAVTEAAVARFRPIIMTSLAMSLGALPLALSLGDASTSRIPLGIVIVGGVMFSLILTLFVIPAMYSYLSTRKKRSALDDIEQNPHQG